MALEPIEFGPLLRFYRERDGRSSYALSKGLCDPSYENRIESGVRDPPHQVIVNAFARALRLNLAEHDRLMVAAGYAPSSVVRLGYWDQALQDVTEVLNDVELTDEEISEFRGVIHSICKRWRVELPKDRS